MSDEYQPNEVVESQPEDEAMPVEPVSPEEPVAPEHVAEPAAATESAVTDSATETLAAGAAWNGATLSVEQETASGGDGPTEAPTVIGPLGAPATDGAAEPPKVVNIADLAAPAKVKPPRPPGQGVGALLQGRGWIIGVVVALLVIVFLLLPPISLAQRVGSGGGFTALDAASPSLAHPDGLEVRRPADATDRVRLKLGSIPRADFVAENVPDTLVLAVEGVPTHLEPKSPFYTIESKAKDAVPATLTVTIPNEAEPWDTLDLYAWDGSAWRWMPSQLDREAEVLVADVAALPTSLMVMQNLGAAQHIVAEVDSWPVAAIDPAIGEANVAGILIGTMGGTTGYADQLPVAADGGETVLVPTVRNWMAGRDANWGLVSDMLVVEADRTAHVSNLLNLARGGGYGGLVVDYRGVQTQDRALFTRFVADLGVAFHDAGLWLAVGVDTPALTADGGWETGGYDWAALGAAADQLRITMPVAPAAYAPGGEAEQLIAWAVTQVERHRLMPVYSTLSTDGTELVGLETVLASMGQVQVMQTVTESVIPGTQLNMTLGQLGVVQTDPETEATRVSAGDESYWLGTPQWLRARMELAARYRLGGVVVRHLFDEGNIAGLVPAIADFLAQGGGTAPASLPEVVWTVTDPTGQATQATAQFAQPAFSWTAPTVTGTYRIAATLGGVEKGSLTLAVMEPAPVITDTLTGEGETAAAADELEDEEEEDIEPAAEGMKAGFVADVTVPDNTRFEKGEDFTKTWRLRNSGTEDWPEDTMLVFASGAELGVVKEVEVGAVKSGDQVDISVDMKAPEEDGTYKSVWELRTAGKAIGGVQPYLVIQVGEPAPEAEAPAPDQPVVAPRPVAAGAFELGGHIRDMGIPYANQMHYAGMNWVKTQVFFGQGAGSIIAAAHAQGFKIQLSAIGGAGMVNEAGFEDKFAAWVAGLAAAGADAIEVWNEPNIDREWQIGKISPAAYTNLLCKSYNAIKGANGGTAVISAAPAPTGWFGGCGPNGCDDKPWMEGLYAAGAANCMDYIGAHHNAGATSPSARIGHPANPGDPHHSWFFLPQTELYYNIFRGTRKLFYTEMGYASQEGLPTFSDQFAWARGTNNSQQAAWLAEAVQLSVNTGMVRCIVVWNIDFVRYETDPQDGFAIIRPGGGCPACETLHGVLGSR